MILYVLSLAIDRLTLRNEEVFPDQRAEVVRCVCPGPYHVEFYTTNRKLVRNTLSNTSPPQLPPQPSFRSSTALAQAGLLQSVSLSPSLMCPSQILTHVIVAIVKLCGGGLVLLIARFSGDKGIWAYP